VKPLDACAFAGEIPSSDDRGTPAAIVHSTPVPAQIMHSNAPRRSMPSFSSFAICFSSCRDQTGRLARRPMGALIYSQISVLEPICLPGWVRSRLEGQGDHRWNGRCSLVRALDGFRLATKPLVARGHRLTFRREFHITSNTRTPSSRGVGASHGEACKAVRALEIPCCHRTSIEERLNSHTFDAP
jgi:hypothetical protein